MEYYNVTPAGKPINAVIEVPGSKSITNRALFLAAMAKGKSVLTNVLFSGDSRVFMDCLNAIGIRTEINEPEKRIEIWGTGPDAAASVCARVNAGSAGTAARFITAMLAARHGTYIIDASEQMKKRPMNPLFTALKSLGAGVEYLEEEGFLPVKILGGELSGGEIEIDCTRSSQFLSALLMTGHLHASDLKLRPAGREISKSYVDITLKMMRQFGGAATESVLGYTVKAGGAYTAREYKIEPDVSSACYFYAAAALTGGSVIVRGVRPDSMQGDIKFLDVLKSMGCTLTETPDGIRLDGFKGGKFRGVDIDMNDFSDQTMTLAAMAPFASSPTVIRNVGHIKHQESDRIHAILTELGKTGVKCGEIPNGIVIYPGEPKPAAVETYDDHRMAMAFSLIGLRVRGVRIVNPACTAKTFENYFEIFSGLSCPLDQEEYFSIDGGTIENIN